MFTIQLLHEIANLEYIGKLRKNFIDEFISKQQFFEFWQFVCVVKGGCTRIKVVAYVIAAALHLHASGNHNELF